MENLIKMDDLGVPLFLETPIFWVVHEVYRNHNNLTRFFHPKR